MGIMFMKRRFILPSSSARASFNLHANSLSVSSRSRLHTSLNSESSSLKILHKSVSGTNLDIVFFSDRERDFAPGVIPAISEAVRFLLGWRSVFS